MPGSRMRWRREPSLQSRLRLDRRKTQASEKCGYTTPRNCLRLWIVAVGSEIFPAQGFHTTRRFHHLLLDDSMFCA